MSGEEYGLLLDILIEIFKRLPVKSLIKCTSVSKSWKSVIKSSEFITDYNSSRHIQQPPHQEFVGYDYNSSRRHIQLPHHLIFPPMPHFQSKSLMGYSQGLLGFHCYKNNVNPADDVDSVVVIWNPSIRKSVFIPIPQHRIYLTNFVFTVCNATDPTIFKITYIFGSPQVEIFALSTGVWRTLSNAPRKSLRLTVKKVAIDRFIHWIAYDWTPGGNRHLILSFDITSEQFTELCLPPSLAAHTSISNLDLSKHKESLVVLEEDECKQEIGVWMMMMMEPGVQNSFRKLYTVKPPYTREFPTLLGFRKNGQPIIYLEFSCHIQKEVVLFYEGDLEHLNEIEISGSGSTAGSYMETLLLLDH